MRGVNAAVIPAIIQIDILYGENGISLVLLLPLPLRSLAILAQIKIKQGGGFPRTVRAACEGEVTALAYVFVADKDLPGKNFCSIYKNDTDIILDECREKKKKKRVQKCLPDLNLTVRLAAHSICKKT